MANVWVQRAAGPGTPITGVYALRQPGIAEEEMDELDPEVVTYRAGRRQRGIYDIYYDISGLTGAQQLAIWTDLHTPVVTPRYPGGVAKWALDRGVNAGAIMALQWAAVNSNATAANLNDAKRRAVAAYVQDNKDYLVHPAFDPSINIPGDEPAV